MSEFRGAIVLCLDRAERGGVLMRTIRQANCLREAFPEQSVTLAYYSATGSADFTDAKVPVCQMSYRLLTSLSKEVGPVVVFAMAGRALVKLIPLRLITPGLYVSVFQAVPLTLPGRSKLKNMLRAWLACALYKQADAVVCVSRELQRDLVASFGLHQAVHIPNPAGFESSEPGQDRQGRDVGLLRVVAAGRLDFQKNYELIIEAISLCNGRVQLDIYGDGPDRDQLAVLIERFGLGDCVKLMGNVPVVPYERYSCFLMVSRWEGLPSAMIEAATCGLRCVAYACPTGPIDIFLSGARGCLFFQSKAEAIKDALLDESNDYAGDLDRLRHTYSAQRIAHELNALAARLSFSE